MKVKTIIDTSFKCDCGCGSQLSVGNWGDGQFSFSVKETADDSRFVRWNEVVMSSKNIKKIIKLLNN